MDTRYKKRWPLRTAAVYSYYRCCLSRRRFDFQSPSRMDRNVEMFMQVEKSLVSQKQMQMPAIFIQSDVDKALTSKLKDIIKRHQGTIVDSEDDASHIIYALPPNPPAEGQFGIVCVSVCFERLRGRKGGCVWVILCLFALS